ncbi:MAG: FGGY family carbohydrate kinase [Flaviflexus sp.]|uniref:FGGY family carbohydrate kinase n=1 Tax=Flaviflexus sp. TaxID=1969482 RepID=UPI003F92F2D9
MEVIIGVDGGTTAVKAVAFTLDGEIYATHHESVPVNYGPSGEAEQDMNLIWQAVADCLSSVVKQLDGHDIVGIGLTGQGDGVWLVDEVGEPVRPAANWMDGRAGDRVAAWTADGKDAKVLEVTGTSLFSGLFPVLLEELRENEPDVIARAATQLYCKDWLRFRLTGERATDYSEASRTFLDVRDASGYSEQLAASLNMTDALALLPEVRHPAGKASPLSAEASEITGIPEGTPVGVGQIDVAVTGAGLGMVENGNTWLILGTTGFVGTLLPSVSERKSDLSMVLATGNDAQVLEFMAPMTGTPNLDWIKKMLGLEVANWGDIETVARKAGPGSHGVVYLPYASPGGERAPFLDPHASASWQGMSLTTEREDILRSVYEGVAFSLVECIETLEVQDDLLVSGGGFRSDLLCEILADATGLTVVRQDAPEAGARGAAVLGLVSAGRYDTVEEAARALGATTETFEPNAENRDIYRAAYDLFLETRAALRPVWPDMRNLRKQTN